MLYGVSEGIIETNHSPETSDMRLLNLLGEIEDAYSDNDFVLVSDLLPYLIDYSDVEIVRAKASLRKPRLWPPAQQKSE